MSLKTVYWDDVKEGEELPRLVKEVTATTIIAGAIASSDFMPVHHDRDYAQKQGNKDIFMNILTTNGWVSRYLTDWTGPEGELKKIALRLGVSCYAGDTFAWTGKVTRKYAEAGQHLVDVEYVARVSLGDHCTGTATIALPTKAR